jgi:hypothetical protein
MSIIDKQRLSNAGGTAETNLADYDVNPKLEFQIHNELRMREGVEKMAEV